MSRGYELEAHFPLEDIAPQQVGIYDAQLRAIADFTLKGAGATIGVGSGASQYYLQLPGARSEYVSTFIWPSSTEDRATCFAVLPPQDFSHRYFGVTAPATASGEMLWVEGVDVHSTGSRYGKLLLNYESSTDPAVRVPLAIGALVGDMRGSQLQKGSDEVMQGVGMTPDVHSRLATSLLSFWHTLELPAHVTGEGSRNRAAFDLARQVIGQGLSHAKAHGALDCRYDSITELTDIRGMQAGFVGKDTQSNSLTALVRHPIAYPERVDYIQIPLSYTDGDAVVSHYAISPHNISARFCVVPAQKIAHTEVPDLVGAIQANKRPMERLDPEGTDDVIRQLFDELGGFVKVLHHTPTEQL